MIDLFRGEPSCSCRERERTARGFPWVKIGKTATCRTSPDVAEASKVMTGCLDSRHWFTEAGAGEVGMVSTSGSPGKG